jgi:hypothetical protein
MSTFSALMVSLAGPVVKKALAAIGIGVLSYAAIQTVFSAAQSALLTSYGQISADIVGPLNMAGFGQAIGIVLGAMAARISLIAAKRLGMIQS